MKVNVPGGKGSSLRPAQVSPEQFDANWEAIFGKKEAKETHQCQNCQNRSCEKQQQN